MEMHVTCLTHGILSKISLSGLYAIFHILVLYASAEIFSEVYCGYLLFVFR